MSFSLRFAFVPIAIVAGATEPVAAQATGSENREPVARVTDVHRAGAEGVRIAGIGDEIAVVVQNPGKLVHDKKPVRLYVNGRMVPGLQAEHGPAAEKNRIFYFALQRQDVEGFWASILGRPQLGTTFFNIPVSVSVGVENGVPLATDVATSSTTAGCAKPGFCLRRIGQFAFIAGVVLFVIVAVGLIWLARNTNMVRDRASGEIAKLQADQNILGPYSLARVQMMVWFVFVVGSFFFIWLVTGNADTITASALGLIGIGTGTALLAATVEVVKGGESQDQALQSFRNRRSVLEAKLANTPTEATQEVEEDIVAVKRQIDALVPRSENFAVDLLTDINGVNIHRFQMVVWTLVLVVLFLHAVWSRLSMPEFNATLLALQGISGGTYLGFKIPERQS